MPLPVAVAERLAAGVELDRATVHHGGSRRLSRDQLAALVNGLGNLLGVLATAAPENKTEVYGRLGPRLTYDPSLLRAVIAESDPWEKAGVPRSGSPAVPAARHPTAVFRTELALAG